ncbi:hypothetical protein CKO31_22965 [Thiohalocapsa halophila]|uniref:Uncharacterized protein n=1 Tax=Thiohalocapsa halophila TaxID=69359 RepID=A0ABS1CPE3_9GAMM|nr:hypothetical protein [Thiohalocapsa halophila]MBK1633553.1 hypothetical protein [Thiohalocapsa halophila]
MPDPAVRTDPATLRCPRDGDDAIGLLRDQYEQDLVEEARLIAQADDDAAATCEHLRVLLAWLDGRRPRGWQAPAQPFDADVPF